MLGGCASTAAGQLESGDPAASFDLRDWVTNVPEVTDLVFLSDGRAVITRKTGEIAVARPDGSLQAPAAARITVDSASEKGLLGVVRDDEDRLYLYASTGDDTSDKHKVYTATVDANGKVSVDLARPIVTGGLEGPANHDGGGMIIHEGQLYIGVGDTGRNASPPRNQYGTCLNKPNGKILRVNLDGSIPADNPLVSVAMATGCPSPEGALGMFAPDERIYAWGLRNPWRFWIDPETDLLWIGDVGEVTQEEITVGGKGVHHGWPFREGTVDHGDIGGLSDCMQVVPATPCVAPQHGYERDDGISVTGGLIPPSGCGWGAFEQRYFFADFGSSRVWTLDVAPNRRGTVDGSRRDFARIDGVVSFRMGPDGAMYIASYTTGAIEKLTPKNVPPACSGPRSRAAPGPAEEGSSGGCALSSRRTSLGAIAGLLLLAASLRIRRRLR